MRGILTAPQVAQSTTAVTGAVWGTLALPTIDGVIPRYVMVAHASADPTAGEHLFVRPGLTTTPAITTTNGMMLPDDGRHLILWVRGATHMLHVATSGTPLLVCTPIAR